MKKCAFAILLLAILTGCSDPKNEMETGLQLRSKLLQSSGCSFQASITADYGDKIHTFSMNCNADAKGNIAFTVTEPNTISGITGTLSGAGGNLVFDDTALTFDLLAEEQLSPISAPWILLNTLRSGCITSCCTENGLVRLSVDDSYDADALRLDIWLDGNHHPGKAEILCDGRKILSLSVEQFEIL